MRRAIHFAIGAAFAATMAMTATACEDFVGVRTPDVIDAGTVDPAADGETFSRSAFQTFASAYGDYIRNSGWFVTEAWVGDTFPTRNEFGRRNISPTNGTFNSEVWFPLSRSVSQSDQAIEALEEGPSPGSDVNIARAALASGFGVLLIAESFCTAPLRQPGNVPGPALSTEQLLDEAIQRLTRARDVGAAAGGEGVAIAQAAQVGIARAHLQAGRAGEAAAAAGQVDPEFVFEIPYVDQLGERGRLGNGVFLFSAGGSRESLVVPPVYRERGVNVEDEGDDGDPRIPWRDADRPAQDGTLNMYSQMKYPGWAAPIRLASGLEARYIIAEASGDMGAQLALIAERRGVGGQPAFDSGDADEVLEELMAQRSRDFWLEGKRMGDFRRNPGHVPDVLEGDYYKPAVGTMGTQTCFPIPQAEIDANPNL